MAELVTGRNDALIVKKIERISRGMSHSFFLNKF
jgi:hypothetical protein